VKCLPKKNSIKETRIDKMMKWMESMKKMKMMMEKMMMKKKMRLLANNESSKILIER
jgi:hypothetical protein